MDAAFCVETLEDALARHGKPDIFNTDQGSQFTEQAFIRRQLNVAPTLTIRRIPGARDRHARSYA
jgi:hypothetical protein